ncbi:MAG: serine hydrolase, partial [Bacteroidota bacterium]
MKKRRYTPRRLLTILIIFLVLMGIFYLAAPKYVSRALIYQKVNIDDYKIFHNREVKAESPAYWETSEVKKEIPSEYLEGMKEYEPVAFLVVKDKKIVSEHYWNGYDKDSRSNAFS